MRNIVFACIIACTFNAFANDMSCDLESNYNEFIEMPDNTYNINLYDNAGSISYGRTLFSGETFTDDDPDVRAALVSFSFASLKLALYNQNRNLQNLSDALSQIELGTRQVIVGKTVERYIVTEEIPEERSIVDAIIMLGCAIANLAEFMNEKNPKTTTIEDKEGNTYTVDQNIHSALVHANNAKKKFSKLKDSLPGR